ncbi:B-box zinc finger protein 32 [Elaeis guineensis]|uniref:B-box zinc finger protein 32 n=1 Tax=Elaeis guineensis var. tenera TaxID=51953 RepID=A0A6I9RJB6_ELAGV|nr:B-box zinc finger protein 32 [Elaeis guineensis]
MKGRRRCELCKGIAAVYCEADAAFLCWPCDARVHGANFLVARHLRRIACAECHALDDARIISGAGSPPIRSLCGSCRRSPPEETASSDSSSCVSTADSESARRGAEEQGILVNWARRMGLGDPGSRRCAAAATRVLRACSGKMTATPLRVGLAAALWFAVKRRGTCEGARLRALELCSGVPAKLIVVAESRLARAARRARVGEEKEGWAECR